MITENVKRFEAHIFLKRKSAAPQQMTDYFSVWNPRKSSGFCQSQLNQSVCNQLHMFCICEDGGICRFSQQHSVLKFQLFVSDSLTLKILNALCCFYKKTATWMSFIVKTYMKVIMLDSKDEHEANLWGMAVLGLFWVRDHDFHRGTKNLFNVFAHNEWINE